MITEDYVSFAVSKLLNEKGFNEETEHVYSDDGELLKLSHLGIKNLTNSNCNGYHTWQFPIEDVASIISAPTQAVAMKWLREVNKIFIEISPTYSEEKKSINFIWQISDSNYDVIADCERFYNKYEQACEAAIKYCLENLI